MDYPPPPLTRAEFAERNRRAQSGGGDGGMKYGSVCSGIEAATVAWEPLGWRPSFFAEIDRFPSAVLAHRFPDVPNAGDFTTIQKGQYADISLLVGGTPCQSFSVSGLRKGLDDDRGNLALEFCRLLLRLRPRWFVWENVPGVLSTWDETERVEYASGVYIDANGTPWVYEHEEVIEESAFLAILKGFEECGYGYAWRVLDAQYVRVDGLERAVPQRRRRVFVVGHIGDWRPPCAVLLEPESLCGGSAPRREAGEGYTRDVAHSLASGGCRSRARVGDTRGQDNVVCMAHGQGGAEITDECAPSLTCNHEAPIAFGTTQITSKCNYSNPQPGDPCHPLAAGAHAPAIAFENHGTVQRGVSETVRAQSHGALPMVAVPIQEAHAATVRRLTPRECERLQGFPDDWTRIPWRGKPAEECPDNPRYKALGNSMAVNVMRWIGRRIETYMSVVEDEE